MDQSETIIIVGPMASGKTTLAKELEEKHGYQRIVTYTTRPMREGEQNGVDYNFIDNETFNTMLKSNIFVEDREYKVASGEVWHYASAWADYISEGKKVVVLDPFGAIMVVNRFDGNNKNIMADKKPFLVWLDIPQEITMRRALDRGDSVEEVYRRHKEDFGLFSTTLLKHGRYVDIRISSEYPVDKLAEIVLWEKESGHRSK